MKMFTLKEMLEFTGIFILSLIGGLASTIVIMLLVLATASPVIVIVWLITSIWK